MNKKAILAVLAASLFFVGSIFAQKDEQVVRLNCFVAEYDVEGLANNYVYRSHCGEPDFGSAKILKEEFKIVGVGSGVVATSQGLILTNAHVTSSFSKPKIIDAVDSNGKPIKRITVNIAPSYLFVGMNQKDSGKAGLRYAAKILYEDADYQNGIKDRAVLCITNKVTEDSEGLPVVGEKIKENELNLACAVFGNPFQFYADEDTHKELCMAGFSDDDSDGGFVEMSGEFMSYYSEKTSKILHSCWIPNGSSGSGIFYNGKLIGINTWDYSENFSRPMSLAQPITWFFEPLQKVLWSSDGVKIPTLDYGWLKDDLSAYSDKDNALCRFALKTGSNNAISVNDGTLVIFLERFTVADVLNYKKVAKQLDEAWEAVRLLGFYSVDEVAAMTGKSVYYVERLQGLKTVDDLKRLINKSAKKYFDLWLENEFVYAAEKLNGANGRVCMAVPKREGLQLVYLDKDGYVKGKWKLRLSDDYLQKEYILNVKN